MGKILTGDFFNRDTVTVAQELLGKFLVRRLGQREISAMITETEAYDGPNDLASHASKGRTKRTEVMFSHPGIFYVYLVYGMHDMLNVVTREKNYPAAVLIRSVEFRGSDPFTNSIELVNGLAKSDVFLHGPGKVTKFLKIDKKLNGKAAEKSNGLWFEDRKVKIPKFKVKKLPRVGVAYAGPVWSSKKLRFLLLN